MNLLEKFPEITRANEPLAPYTWLKIGGPAQYFAEPRSVEELTEVVAFCNENAVKWHIIGAGSNLLVLDNGVSGAVISLNSPAFGGVTVEGVTAHAGAGTLLSHLVTRTVAAGLSGFETLAGVPGTIGGAIFGNAGGRAGEISQYLKSLTILNASGEQEVRTANDIDFSYRSSGLDGCIVLSAGFELIEDEPEEITRRLRKIWIMKKTTQPLTFQSAGCIFKNPRGLSAGALIEQAGLKGTRVGDCEVSDRHANFIITHENATSDDLMRLIDLVRSKVLSAHGVELELEIQIWT